MDTVPTTIKPSEPAPQATPEPQNWWDSLDSTPQSTEPQAPAPQVPAQPEWFLRSEDGSVVYRTSQDAVKGLSEKDRTISQQKEQIERAQKLLEAAGVHVGPQGQPRPAQPTLVTALEAAIQRGDMSFDQAIATLVQQQTQYAMQPLMPLIEHAAISRAVEVAGGQFDPNIPAFVKSPAYQLTLAKWPSLRTAISNAAAFPQHYGNILPELLAQAYTVAKAAAPAAPAQRPAPQSVTPPEVIQRGVLPQGSAPVDVNNQDPFEAAYNAIRPDLLDMALTGENFNRR